MSKKKPKKEKLTLDQLNSTAIAKELGISPGSGDAASDASSKPGRMLKHSGDHPPQRGLQEPPMMYRAQVQGRCNLQFAGDRGNNTDRTQWMEEWLQSSSHNPRYQYLYEKGSDRAHAAGHSFVVKFPYRVFSNSGQDSIHRPVLSQYGIPYIPGSSIKGLLKRLVQSQSIAPEDRAKIQTYCGDEENPGTLRFHGAYPVGNWANQIVDVVHPQQERQVERNESGSAFALLSFYRPNFIFELSSNDANINWQDVEQFVRVALRQGLGGKTSTGYGFAGVPDYANPKHSDYTSARHIALSGVGVSSLLLNGEPEFRPNLFKAALRGHLKRLLAGVCSSESRINQEVNHFFGSTDGEGTVKLFYQFDENNLNTIEIRNRDAHIRRPASYRIQGTLHIHTASADDLSLLEKVLQFTYIMGGFGKSWRRVWHEAFYPNYTKFHIGCHWISKDIQTISSPEDLERFLNGLYQLCCDRLQIAPSSPAPMQWRESWNPERLAVYCRKGHKSDAVTRLFHRDDFNFKNTLAIGGRTRSGAPTAVSSVWHRNLPIGQDAAGKDEYLEIVTLFHGGDGRDRTPWMPSGVDQLPLFINALANNGLKLKWGEDP